MEGYRIELNDKGEIAMPGEIVPEGTQLFAPLTPAEEAEFLAESDAIIEAGRPQPGQSDLRFRN